ncbi:MAG: ATP-binding protein, partial [Gaiellales bacterium]
MAKDRYSAADIRVLEGLEPVRVRPGMYIGGTNSRALHHLIWEVVDNAVDEALAGRCSNILVEIADGEVITVVDDGRGIPVDIHPEQKVSALELVFTKLHAGGKFGDGGYKVSGGLHGVGASVTNALSEWLEVEVRRDGKLWTQTYARGVPKGPVKDVRELKKGEGTGTTVRFTP